MSEKTKKSTLKMAPCLCLSSRQKVLLRPVERNEKIVWTSKKQILNNTGIVLAAIAL
jgi:hypothetical protein